MRGDLPLILKMGFFDGILGLDEVNRRLQNVEERVAMLEDSYGESAKRDSIRILNLLKSPMKEVEIASKVKKSKRWVSYILTRLEREGKVMKRGDTYERA
jgi:hypothetical protein